MGSAKEIRTKIASIQSTKKITRAMEMVAASKMRRAQNRMESSRPYSLKIRDVIKNVVSGNLEYRHPYIFNRPVNKVGYIVISSDRGLCGGLNANLFRSLLKKIVEFKKDSVDLCFSSIGKKSSGFLKRVNASVVSSTLGLGDSPDVSSVTGLVKVMVDLYDSNEVDRVYVCYNKFVNTMTQKPVFEQLLPLEQSEKKNHFDGSACWDYIYEPDATLVIDALLSRYIETLIYHGVAENMASEQSSRMVAMKAASDNAGNVIDELTLVYNKARQAAITKEISEIVGGAAAVS
jgi:F-type H+-transporting ATPase subunit gamma